MNDTVRITARVSETVKEKIESLAQRRYGDRSQKSQDHVVNDILTWLLAYWDMHGQPWSDFLWLKIAFMPFSWLRAICWGKLITGYFTKVGKKEAADRS